MRVLVVVDVLAAVGGGDYGGHKGLVVGVILLGGW